jgi:prepilin-type N-terminal cleavage/methylation domain-containing protein/prepilin-type processing-associated H-X9-DG protein
LQRGNGPFPGLGPEKPTIIVRPDISLRLNVPVSALAVLNRPRQRTGFTLVELMVVVSVISVLMALLLVGVQTSREMARKTSCANNLRNQMLAVQEFQAARQHYPAGRQVAPRREYAWCVDLLPHLAQPALYARFDRSRPWNDGGQNQVASQTTLAVFRCASAIRKFPGKTDYGGVMGSTLTVSPGFDFENGVMIEVGAWRKNYLTPAEIEDGLSQTIAVAECVDRDPDAGGLWVSGFNAFSHDNGSINGKVSDDICSKHPGGAQVGFADGRVHFLSQNTAANVVGALCTRNGGERVNGF